MRALLERLTEREARWAAAQAAASHAAARAVVCAREADACDARLCRELDRAAAARRSDVQTALASLCQRRASHAADAESVSARTTFCWRLFLSGSPVLKSQ